MLCFDRVWIDLHQSQSHCGRKWHQFRKSSVAGWCYSTRTISSLISWIYNWIRLRLSSRISCLGECLAAGRWSTIAGWSLLLTVSTSKKNQDLSWRISYHGELIVESLFSTSPSGIRVRLGEWNMKAHDEPLPHEDHEIERKEVIIASTFIHHVFLFFLMCGFYNFRCIPTTIQALSKTTLPYWSSSRKWFIRNTLCPFAFPLKTPLTWDKPPQSPAGVAQPTVRTINEIVSL